MKYIEVCFEPFRDELEFAVINALRNIMQNFASPPNTCLFHESEDLPWASSTPQRNSPFARADTNDLPGLP